MGASGNILQFKDPYEAHEHCMRELEAWHPQWQTALKSNDLDTLRTLTERYRYRVLAVFPERYVGSLASAKANFAYRLSDLAEFEHPAEHLNEARALYEIALPHCAPEWSRVNRATKLHCYAEILLRLAELGGDTSGLHQAKDLCLQASAVWDGESRRYHATLGAVLRRLAEQNPSGEAWEAALAALERAESDHDSSTGDLSWALQRRTLATVLLLRGQGGANADDLRAAYRAVRDAIANYQLNPHQFWIRPSSLQDAMKIRAQIEALI